MTREPSKSVRVGNPRAQSAQEKPVMQDAKTFKRYAEECQRLADKMPDHRETLLEMADVWLACAKAADIQLNGSQEAERPGMGKRE
jgi:hypothetical protein